MIAARGNAWLVGVAATGRGLPVRRLSESILARFSERLGFNFSSYEHYVRWEDEDAERVRSGIER